MFRYNYYNFTNIKYPFFIIIFYLSILLIIDNRKIFSTNSFDFEKWAVLVSEIYFFKKSCFLSILSNWRAKLAKLKVSLNFKSIFFTQTRNQKVANSLINLGMNLIIMNIIDIRSNNIKNSKINGHSLDRWHLAYIKNWSWNRFNKVNCSHRHDRKLNAFIRFINSELVFNIC